MNPTETLVENVSNLIEKLFNNHHMEELTEEEKFSLNTAYNHIEDLRTSLHEKRDDK